MHNSFKDNHLLQFCCRQHFWPPFYVSINLPIFLQVALSASQAKRKQLDPERQKREQKERDELDEDDNKEGAKISGAGDSTPAAEAGHAGAVKEEGEGEAKGGSMFDSIAATAKARDALPQRQVAEQGDGKHDREKKAQGSWMKSLGDLTSDLQRNLGLSGSKK